MEVAKYVSTLRSNPSAPPVEGNPSAITEYENVNVKVTASTRGVSSTFHFKTECGGSQICVHRRIRAKCKDCKGSAICEHGTTKYECRKCKGSQICEHDRVRSKCKDCGGSSFCQHGRLKRKCKDCGGKGLCPHFADPVTCIECKSVVSAQVDFGQSLHSSDVDQEPRLSLPLVPQEEADTLSRMRSLKGSDGLEIPIPADHSLLELRPEKRMRSQEWLMLPSIEPSASDQLSF